MGVVESWVGQALSKCNTADCLFDRWEAGNGLIGILAEWKQVAQQLEVHSGESHRILIP